LAAPRAEISVEVEEEISIAGGFWSDRAMRGEGFQRAARGQAWAVSRAPEGGQAGADSASRPTSIAKSRVARAWATFSHS